MSDETEILQPEIIPTEIVKRGEGGRFLKGQSGNPKGRPKVGETLAEIVRGKLENKLVDADGNVVSNLEMMLSTLLVKAKEGSEKAIEILLDRGYGKAKTFLEITTKEEFVLDWGEDGGLIEGEVLDENNQNQLTATTS